LHILGTVFSQFLTKEISTSRNIKDRLNRQKVTSTLTKINEALKTIKLSDKGNFFFFGYDEYDQFISVILEPEREYKGFYYSCSSTFVVDIVFPYFERKYGSIIFISGEQCNVYILIDGQFQKKRTINGNIQKRQKKGG
jgi:peptide subunit release factor 1 (eRF1)